MDPRKFNNTASWRLWATQIHYLLIEVAALERNILALSNWLNVLNSDILKIK